jgi:hypothetical protein
MRTSIPAIAALLEGGRVNLRTMIRFGLDGGPQGIWNDSYQATIGGVSYSPAAIQLGEIGSRKDLSAEQLDITISALNPNVAAIMSGIAWHQRPVLVSRAYIDDAGLVIDAEAFFSGFLDAAPIEDEADGTIRMTLICESNNRELSRSANRVRSDADQRRIAATDGFFKHTTASAVDNRIYWGRKGPQSPGT